MHLLYRHISPYTESDCLLGVYRTLDEAEEQREEYLRTILGGELDPWRTQAYHAVSDDDIKILSSVPLVGTDDAAERVYVVSSYAEGFGQIVRRFEAIAGSESIARNYAVHLEEGADDHFPSCCEVDEVMVGTPITVDFHFRTGLSSESSHTRKGFWPAVGRYPRMMRGSTAGDECVAASGEGEARCASPDGRAAGAREDARRW